MNFALTPYFSWKLAQLSILSFKERNLFLFHSRAESAAYCFKEAGDLTLNCKGSSVSMRITRAWKTFGVSIVDILQLELENPEAAQDFVKKLTEINK
jgi:hypothetical protein